MSPKALKIFNCAVDQDVVSVTNCHPCFQCNADYRRVDRISSGRRQSIFGVFCRHQNARRTFMEKQ